MPREYGMKYCLSARSVALLSLLVSGTGLAQSPQSLFYAVTPCRAVDTRNPNGVAGGPALVAGGARAFQLAGACGIPITARAVVTNVTVVNPSSAGDLAIFPSGTPGPQGATAINFKAGRTRANNFIARLGTTGDIAVFSEMPSGTVHFLIDVSGYFEDPPGSPLSTYTTVANLTTFGATPQTVAHIRDVGVNGWLNEQFSIPPNYFVPMALFPDTIPGACTGTCQRDNYTMYPLQNTFLYNALYYPDQLRQRVVWALHKFLVISGQQEIQPSHMIPYLNILVGNAFGNYKNILAQLTLNPAMGDYLNMRTSTLQNPNENYAREILQLFSIGLVQLNTDGTPKLDLGGNTIPTYSQDDINELSRVFTGWRLAAPPVAGTSNYTSDMALVEASHDRGKKSFLCDWSSGTPTACAWTFNANQNGDVDVAQAIDAIMAHPNVAPYVSTQLIHGLVTSNPSPAYVGRVAAVFNNNGSGVKGDLAAVVRAIVTDTEALAGATDPNFGILRDPVYFALALLRGLGATAANGTGRSDAVLAPQLANLGQNLFNPDTVFSYYPADNRLPGSSTMWGPEYGIQSALTALRRANLVNTLVYSNIPTGANNPSGTALDLSVIQSLSNDPAAMVEQLNQILCRGQLSAGAKAAIVTAVNAVPASSPRQRAQQATYLVATSSQFQVER
jgi:uncharacterized protein (DUF1800 family)